MDESFQDYSCIQDFEAVWKVGLKILKRADYDSFSDLFLACLKTVDYFNMNKLIFYRKSASFRI